MRKIKISIIIPVYNCEKTIEKCLNSIMNQTYKNIEIIVINDGSTDNTGKVIKGLMDEDKRIIYVENTNKGVSYSRNCGVKFASGNYITYVDSDDWLDENCIYEIINKIKPEDDFIRYNFNVIGGKSFSNELYELKDCTYNLNYEENRKKVMQHFLTNNKKVPNLVFLLVIKSDIAKKIFFNEKLTMMEDVDYYLQLFLSCDVCTFIDSKKYNYYVNPDSVTHAPENYKKNILGIINANISIINQIKNTQYSSLIKEINTNHVRIITNYISMMFSWSEDEAKMLIKELMCNRNFKELIKAIKYKYLPLKNKIILVFIRYKLLGVLGLLLKK